MPALATTMSRRPNSSTPSGTTASTASASRTSAWLATIAAASCLDELDRLLEFRGRRVRVVHRVDVGADVQSDDVGAVTGESDRVGAALPARGAGDESDFAFQISHECSSLSDRCVAGVGARQSQAFFGVVDLDAPVAARARGAEVAVLGQDRLTVAVAAGVGDAGKEFQWLLVECAVVSQP